MTEIITKEISSGDLKEAVSKLIPDSIAKDIEKSCHSIYPIHEVYIRKVKVLKKPKFDMGKLLDMHGEGAVTKRVTTEDGTGVVISRPEGYEPPIQESV